jgi:hypothetical protein
MVLSLMNATQEERVMSDVTHVCSTCLKEASVKTGEPIPFCCGKEMAPLPFCTTAPQAEMARNSDADEPCDNGTQPRKRN